jgi:hypothetical protein
MALVTRRSVLPGCHAQTQQSVFLGLEEGTAGAQVSRQAIR